MDAPSRGISRRTCMGMMMSALAGCRSSTTLHAASPPEIAITIDDFDLNASTPLLDPDARNEQILDALRAMRVQAAAFVCGKQVDNPEGRRRLALWSDAGHMIANHTYSHGHYHRTDFEKFSADVLQAEAVIESYPTFRKWFRFPYLKEGATVEQRAGRIQSSDIREVRPQARQ